MDTVLPLEIIAKIADMSVTKEQRRISPYVKPMCRTYLSMSGSCKTLRNSMAYLHQRCFFERRMFERALEVYDSNIQYCPLANEALHRLWILGYNFNVKDLRKPPGPKNMYLQIVECTHTRLQQLKLISR